MDSYFLSTGAHHSPSQGRCAMEWVAYIAGEEHSDSPKCVDPALRRFGIGLNDYLPDDLRQKLRPYLARMIGTADDGRTQERLYMMADWAIRVAAAKAQDAVGRKDLGDRLRAVPGVVDRKTAEAAEATARDVRAAANAAANANAAARRPMWEELLPSALSLLNRMLPAEWIDLPEPVQTRAQEVCAINKEAAHA